jgi:hypothetical protein
MVECSDMRCRHYPFRGKTAWCQQCDVYKEKPTGKDCARCGKPIMVHRHEPQLLQFLCVPCSIEARKHEFGLATDANPLYCYYIATGKFVSIEFARRVNEKELSELTPEERDYYEKAEEGFRRMSGRHSLMGGIWKKR